MDAQFWHDRWHANDIGFHQPKPHDGLTKHWPKLGLAKGTAVLVPLAGKSLDMVWMADRGHEVLGVELSPLAIDSFFAERCRAPAAVSEGGFTVKRAGPFELWCGDFLSLPASATRRIAGVYDRAALVAMSSAAQHTYARKLAELTPRDVPVLLVALNYDPSEMDGPPFPIPRDRVAKLFSPLFGIEHLEDRDGLASSARLRGRGVTWLTESIYVLRRNGRAHG
jgi:thiopurine S-methyltransferase